MGVVLPNELESKKVQQIFDKCWAEVRRKIYKEFFDDGLISKKNMAKGNRISVKNEIDSVFNITHELFYENHVNVKAILDRLKYLLERKFETLMCDSYRNRHKININNKCCQTILKKYGSSLASVYLWTHNAIEFESKSCSGNSGN